MNRTFPCALLALILGAQLTGCAGSPRYPGLGIGGRNARPASMRDYLNPPFVPVSVHFQGDFDPALSRNGRRLVFTSGRSGNWDLWSIDLTRRDAPEQLTAHSAADFAPAVSPDGKRVAFISRRNDAKGDLAFIDLEPGESGFSIPALQEYSVEEDPAWINDRAILLSRLQQGKRFLSVYNLRTGNFEDTDIADASQPDVSPDGRWAIFTRKTSNHTQIEVSPVTGTHIDKPRRLTDLPYQEAMAVFAGNGRIYVAAYADDTNADGVIDMNDKTTLWTAEFDPRTGKAGADYQALTSSDSVATLPAATETSLVMTSDRSGQLNLWALNLGVTPDFTDQDPVKLARSLPSLSDRLLAYRRIVPGIFGNEASRAALYYRADELLKAGYWGPAQPALDRVIKSSTNDYWARRAQILSISLDQQIMQATGLTLDDLDAATAYETNLEALRTRAHDNKLERDLRAFALVEAGKIQAAYRKSIDALETFKQVETDFRDVPSISAKAALEKARIFSELGDRSAATGLLRKIIVDYESENAAISAAAQQAINLASGLYVSSEDRIAALRRLANNAPGYLQARISLEATTIYLGAGDLAAARAELASSIQMVRSAPEIQRDWTSLFIQLLSLSGDESLLDDSMLPYLQANEASRRKLVDALLLLAEKKRSEGDLSKALRILSLAVRIDPDCPEALYGTWALGGGQTGSTGPSGTAPAPTDPVTIKYTEALQVWKKERTARGANRAIALVDDGLALQFDRPELHQLRGYLSHALEQFLILDNASYSKRQDKAYLESAIESYQTALVYARQSGEFERIRELNLSLAMAFLDFPSPNYRLAAEFMDEYFKGAGYPSDPRRALIIADRRARILFQVERYGGAAEAARTGIEQARMLGDKRYELALQEYLGLILESAGHHPDAVAAYQAALDAAPPQGDNENLYLIYRSKAVSEFRSGENDKALDSLGTWEKEVSRSRSHIDKRAKRSPPTFTINVGPATTEAPWGFAAKGEVQLGDAYRSWIYEAKGDSAKALLYGEKTLDAKPDPNDTASLRKRAVVLTQLARLEWEAGNSGKAGDHLAEAYRITSSTQDIRGQTVVLAALMEHGLLDPGTADKDLRQFVRESEAIVPELENRLIRRIPVDLPALAQLLDLRAMIRLKLLETGTGHLDAFLPLRDFVRARKVRSLSERETGISTLKGRLVGYLNEARAAHAAGLGTGIEDSLEEFSEAAQNYRVADGPLWDAGLRCDLEGSEKECLRFLKLADVYGPRVPSFCADSTRRIYLTGLFKRLAAFWTRRFAETQDSKYLELAVETGERGRRVDVLWTLGGRIAAPGRTKDRDLFARLEASLDEWNSAVRTLLEIPEAAASGNDQGKFRDLQKKADELRKTYLSVLKEIAERSPELGYLLALRPPSVSDLQYDLKDGEAVVISYSGSDQFAVVTERELVLVPAGELAARLKDVKRLHWISPDVQPAVPVTSRYVSMNHYMTALSRRNINKRRALLVSDAALKDDDTSVGKTLQSKLEMLSAAIPGIRGFFYDDNGPDRFVQDTSNLASQYHFVHILSPVSGAGRSFSIGLSGGRLPVWKLSALSGEPHLWVISDFEPASSVDQMVFIEMATYAGTPALILGRGQPVSDETAAWQAFYREAIRWQAPAAASVWNEMKTKTPQLSRFDYWGYPGLDTADLNGFASTALNELANQAASQAAAKNWPDAALAAERAVTTMDVIGVDPRLLAQMLNAAVYSLKQLQAWDRAAAYEDRLAKLYEEAGAHAQSAQALYFSGQDYLRANRFDDAFDRFDDALRAVSGNPQMTMVIESERARGLALAGRGEDSVRSYSNAIQSAVAASDGGSKAELLFNRGRVRYESVKDYSGAFEDLQASTALLEPALSKLKSTAPPAADQIALLSSSISRNRITLALVEMARGNYRVAEASLAGLAAEASKAGKSDLAIQARLYKASALRSLFRPDEALSVISAYLRPDCAGPAVDMDAGTAADVFNLAGLLYWSLGREDSSADCSRTALRLARSNTDPARISAILVNLGTGLRVLQKLPEAKEALDEALQIARKRSDPETAVAALLQQALLEQATPGQKRPEAAARILAEGIDLATKFGLKRQSLELRWLRACVQKTDDKELASLWADTRAYGDAGLIARVRTLDLSGTEGTGSPHPKAESLIEAAELWLAEPPSAPAHGVRTGLGADKLAIFRRAVREISRDNPAKALSFWERCRLKLLRDRMWDTGLTRRTLEPVRFPDGRPGATVYDEFAEAIASGRPVPVLPLKESQFWMGLLADRHVPLADGAPGSVLVAAVASGETNEVLWWLRDGNDLKFTVVTLKATDLNRLVGSLTEIVRSQGRYEAELNGLLGSLIPKEIRKRIAGLKSGQTMHWIPDGILEQLPFALITARARPEGGYVPGPVVQEQSVISEPVPESARIPAAAGSVIGARTPRLRAGFGVDIDADGRASFYGPEHEALDLLESRDGWKHCAGELSSPAYSLAGITCAGIQLSDLPVAGFSASLVDGNRIPDNLDILAYRLPALARGYPVPWLLPVWRRGTAGAQYLVRFHSLLGQKRTPAQAIFQVSGELDSAYGHPFVWAGYRLFGTIASPAE